MLRWLQNKMRTFIGDTAGTAVLEFTLVAPLLIVLGLGAGEFGRALQHHHVLNKAARDAARYLARVPGDCTGGIADPAHITGAKNLAMTGYVNGGAPILSYWTDPNTITVTVGCYDNSAGTLRGLSSIPLIRVSIQVPYQDVGFLSLLGTGAFTFYADHTEMHIGE